MWSDEEFFHTLTQTGKSSNENEESTDSDDIPLADIKQRSKIPVRRKLIKSDNESELDDSNADEDYIPNKKDINSSDSESSVLFSMVPTKKGNVRLRKSKTKREQEKVKVIKPSKQTELAKKLREKIKKLQSRRKKIKLVSPDTNRAKQISRQMQSVLAIVKKSHLSRLDTLLASNELRRSSICADGNCFFFIRNSQWKAN